MNPTLIDRVVSILAYCTFGIMSIIWIVFSWLTKKRINSFTIFNLYQAILISIVLSVFALVFDIAVNLLAIVPFVGSFVSKVAIFITRTPIIFSMTLTGFLITILLFYLSAFCLIGKKPKIKGLSDIISANFGG